MITLRDVDTRKFILLTAEKLKAEEKMAMPEWARFVKTGRSRMRPPEQADWWFIRGASILRKVALQSQGVSRLRKEYSGRKNRGHKPEHTFDGSGKIIRVLLRQLEAVGYVKMEKGKGRILTPAGQKFIDALTKDVK